MRSGPRGCPPRGPRSAPACRPKWQRLRCWWRSWSPRVSNGSNRSRSGRIETGNETYLLRQARHGVGKPGYRAKPAVLGEDREIRPAEEQRRGVGATRAPTEAHAVVMRLDPAGKPKAVAGKPLLSGRD